MWINIKFIHGKLKTFLELSFFAAEYIRLPWALYTGLQMCPGGFQYLHNLVVNFLEY
jgi:hypothetical protein